MKIARPDFETRTFHPVCPDSGQRAEVKSSYRFSKGAHDVLETGRYLGSTCSICEDEHCPLIDCPCVPKEAIYR